MTIHLIMPDPGWLVQDLAKNFPAYTCSGWNTALEPGLESVRKIRPDVVMFSFSTPGELSWKMVMEQLKRIDLEIIVLSILPTFAYEAFRLDATGFLLMPPDPQELLEVLQKVERRVLEKARLHRQNPFDP